MLMIIHRWMYALLLGILPCAASAANHALLVGVSNYPSLSPQLQLTGPKNDVELMHGLLQRRGFAAGNIRVLADGSRISHGDPIRANILNELKAITGKAQKGDYIFLFFAGHGSQQPAKDLGPNNPEPDGLDEIFLPRDIGKWDGGAHTVQNAIVDDELGVIVTTMRNKGAFVWAIFDTCHSGTITRGIDDEGVRYRDAKPADLGIPTAAMDKAAKDGAALGVRTRGGPEAAAPMTALQGGKVAAGAGGFVAFYAAQSWERAPEMPQPAHLSAGDPNKRSHGVLTFSLAEVIAMNPAMTYRQAGEQILHRYRGAVRSNPTPLFEGEGASLDATLFGAKAGPQVLQWKIEKSGNTLLVPAGLMHRIADGAIFSVVANPGDPDKAVLGFMQASKVELLQATLMPAARDGKPALDAAKIPDTAYMRLVHPNTSFALRVSLPAPAKGGAEGSASATVEKLAKEKIDGMAVTWLPSHDTGEVRLALRDGHLWFLPASGDLVARGNGKTLSIELAGKTEQQIRDLTVETLRAMARAVNLIKLAAMTGSTPVAQSVDVRMAYVRGGKPATMEPGKMPQLRNGDVLSIAVRNTSNTAVDVNYLFVDSRFGISHLGAERYEANGQHSKELGTVNTATTSGRESVLVIVSEAQPGMPQADFGFLAQATLPVTRGAGGDGLRDLLEAAGFQPERTRGLIAPARTLSTTAFRLFTWNAAAK